MKSLKYIGLCLLLASCGDDAEVERSRCYNVFVSEIHTCVPSNVECRRTLCRVRTSEGYVVPICDPYLGMYLGKHCDD